MIVIFFNTLWITESPKLLNILPTSHCKLLKAVIPFLWCILTVLMVNCEVEDKYLAVQVSYTIVKNSLKQVIFESNHQDVEIILW